MLRSKSARVGALCGVLVLSGCSVQQVQQKAPTTPDDCRAIWFQERGVHVPRETKTFADVVEALFSGFARQTTSTAAANGRYRNCLSNVGVTDVDAFEAGARQGQSHAPHLPRLAPPRPAFCPPGASVLYGGSGYCVGRRF
jgi:hypothetical protein